MSYQCELREQPAQPTLAVRARTAVQDLPSVMGQAYGAIFQYLGELGKQPVGPPFTAYHNMDMQDLDVEIGIPVAGLVEGRGDIQASVIPGGKHATCLHVGPYSEIEHAYTALMGWIAENGYEATGVAYELYLNDPTTVPPEELQTLIQFPLASV